VLIIYGLFVILAQYSIIRALTTYLDFIETTLVEIKHDSYFSRIKAIFGNGHPEY